MSSKKAKILEGWIPQKALDEFKYEYKSPPFSLFEKLFLNRWWEFVVTLYPMTLAPNMITLSGLIILTIPFTLIVVQDPMFEGNASPVLYILAGLALFIY
jgi:ethanolaminephosphotransferase